MVIWTKYLSKTLRNFPREIYRLPPLHPTTFLGDTSELAVFLRVLPVEPTVVNLYKQLNSLLTNIIAIYLLPFTYHFGTYHVLLTTCLLFYPLLNRLLMGSGSWLMPQGSWLIMAEKSQRALPQAPGPLRQSFLGHEP